MIGLLLFALIPLVSAIALSMMKWDGFGKKEFIGFGNFAGQFSNPDFRLALLNTAEYTLLVVPVGIFFSLYWSPWR